VSPAQLVDLIDQHQGVAAARALQALHHLARHGAHICAPERKQGEAQFAVAAAMIQAHATVSHLPSRMFAMFQQNWCYSGTGVTSS
jgi:hypothetical protein